VSATGPGELLRLGLVGEYDVVVLRQRRREVAAPVGLEYQDQVRVATALSELARELVVLSSPATITLSPDGRAVLAEMRSDPALRTVAAVVVTSAELDDNERVTLGATAGMLEKSQLSTPLLLAAAAQATRLIAGAP
jgi:hypothetical protein